MVSPQGNSLAWNRSDIFARLQTVENTQSAVQAPNATRLRLFGASRRWPRNII